MASISSKKSSRPDAKPLHVVLAAQTLAIALSAPAALSFEPSNQRYGIGNELYCSTANTWPRQIAETIEMWNAVVAPDMMADPLTEVRTSLKRTIPTSAVASVPSTEASSKTSEKAVSAKGSETAAPNSVPTVSSNTDEAAEGSSKAESVAQVETTSTTTERTEQVSSAATTSTAAGATVDATKAGAANAGTATVSADASSISETNSKTELSQNVETTEKVESADKSESKDADLTAAQSDALGISDEQKEALASAMKGQSSQSVLALSVAPMLPPPVPAKPVSPVEVPAGDAPLVIDNDEATQIQESIKYEELPTDEHKTHVKAGAKFPVVISSELSSKTAKKGEPFEAKLKYDLKIGDRLIAKRGSIVNGHISYALKARSTMHSLLSPERWYRNSGCIGITFDEIVNDKGEHIPLVAAPAQQALYVKNKAEGRVLGINHDGQITGPWSQQLRYKAVRIGLNAAMAPAGVFTFGAMPVALGVMGAVNPSFAFMKPVGQNVRHRRIKGFVWGALSGVPGSWLIEDTVVKGQEAIIKPGDEFLAEFKEEFTGEAATEANLLPGANAKVHGQVMPGEKKKKK